MKVPKLEDVRSGQTAAAGAERQGQAAGNFICFDLLHIRWPDAFLADLTALQVINRAVAIDNAVFRKASFSKLAIDIAGKHKGAMIATGRPLPQ